MQRPERPEWVPDEQRDTRYWIFFENYLCRVPYIQMLSVEYLEQFGMPYTGDKEYDFGTANEIRTVMIPIARMAELFDKGARISLADISDAPKVYKRISDHLNAWKDNLGVCLNLGEVPIEDLKLLDRLANSVYSHAKYQFTDEIIQSSINRLNSDRMRSLTDLVNFMVTPKAALPPTATLEERYPDRKSMADFFTRTPIRDGSTLNDGSANHMQTHLTLAQRMAQASGVAPVKNFNDLKR